MHSRALIGALAVLPCALAQAQSQANPGNAPQLPAVTVTAPGQDADSGASELRQELAAEQARTPGGVTLLDSEDLKQRSVTSIADALRYVPGVWTATGTTADGAYLSSRGSNLDAKNYDGNGIKLLQDGLPVTAADGNNHNRALDPQAMRQGIVARGANALAYGASTLGGAIDFITPTARDTASEVALSLGSHGDRQASATVGAVNGDLDALVSVEGRRTDGYREHQAQERESLYTNVGWQLSDQVRTRFYASYTNNDQELPGSLTRAQWKDDPEQANPSNVTGNYRYNVELWRVANKTSWDIDADTRLTVGFSYENQQLYHPIVYSPPYFSLLIDTEQRNFGSLLRYQKRLGTHDLLLGVNYGQTEVEGGNYSYTPGGSRSLSDRVDNQAESTELFLLDRWEFASRWTAVYGAQAVSASREARSVTVSSGAVDNPKGDYDSINPRAGLMYQLTPATQLYTSVSRLYEAPTLYELEDDVRGGDKALDAMEGTVLEIGTRSTQPVGANKWHWDVSAYYAKLRNEILSMDDPSAPGTSLATNVDRTVHAGIEALVGARVALNGGASMDPLLSLTLNHFKFDGDGTYGNKDLPAAPTYALKGEVLYRQAGFFAGPTFDVVGERYADFENSYKVDGYTLLGLRAGLSGKGWDVFAEVRNLTDENYVSVLTVKDQASASDAILTPGESRSLHVGARMKF
ncbi:putative outer membrane receptor for iron transport [Hylemonella gracilis ATCC 19624]|uniref:Putative outer membrane receptor for iron transport n=2 Tax=Hylemonella gracilis TaxID=80880 RepID=F3KUZ1_9BURK|nr:putative outer membrane receptor for iron transport [Hylemonella gracilis ATCC 19624]